MQINRDFYNRIEPSRIYLATPNKRILCALNSIDKSDVSFTGKTNDISIISFTITQYIENVDGERIVANGYDLISRYMKLYVTNVGWFILDSPSTHHTGTYEYKEVTASSAQIEYNQVPLDQWKVNRGTTDSLEMLVDGNVEEIEGVEFAKENIKFYNAENPALSLVDILVSKVPGWKVGYIDNIPKTYESIENGETVTTTVLLADEVGTFDIDYSDCYSFIVQDFEKYFNCVVDFDYVNFEVNFYRVENYGNDTNVTIGFRNVENTNDITVDDENIFTKFRVAGGDSLGIEQFNGGSNYLIYLDEYWLNRKYLSDSTVTKYKQWDGFCASARYQYGEYSKQWNELQNEISELQNRVPVGDVDPENWASLSDDALLALKSDYEAQKLGYEKIYVDEDGNFDQEALDASPDANTYYQIVNVILPNIEIEISNRELPTSEGESDYLEEYETTWEWYGVNELEIKLQSYQDAVNILKKSHYDLSWERYQELSQQDVEKYPVLTEDGFKDKHDEYLKNAAQLDESNPDSCAYALAQRQAEVKAKQEEQTSINDLRTALAQKMDINSWKGQVDLDSPELVGFTQSELNEISHILNQSTYTNENIFVSSIQNLTDTVVMQQKLCETALDDIAVYSIPQTSYTTTLDNILTVSGNELHAHDLSYGNFIRLGIRDDYYVKLRVSSISFNPCLYDNNFTIEFTNMIKSGKKRNDFVALLDLAGNLSRSSASTSFSGDVNLSDDNIYQILSRILQSSLFSSKVQNWINNAMQSGIGNGGYLTPGDIYANNGFFEYIQAELIAANEIVANSGDFKELSALVAQIDNLLAGNVSVELGHIISLTAENVQIDEAVIRDLIASQITVGMLKAGTISSDKFDISSDDGSMTIVGNTMQFKDQNGHIRIQIGRDAKDEFTFVLYDENGTGVLIDSTGIKASAIEDGLIQTDMVSDGAITESKIDKTGILEWTDEDGNKIFQVGNMYFGDDKFEVSYTQTVEKIDTVYDRVDSIESKLGSIELMGEQIFKSIQGTVTPSSITLAAVIKNGAEVGNWYIDNVINTEFVSPDKLSFTIPSSYMSDRDSISVKVTDTTGVLYDIQTIYLISDSEGATGQAAISVVITSEKGTVFNEDTSITETLCTCTVYEGVNEITPNSYTWQVIENDSGSWTDIGSERTITIPIETSIIRKRLRCLVDLDLDSGGESTKQMKYLVDNGALLTDELGNCLVIYE